MAILSKFNLLVWKNFVLYKKKPLRLAMMLLCPIIYIILLVVIRKTMKTNMTKHNVTVYSSFDTYNPKIKEIFWSPCSGSIEGIMKEVSSKFSSSQSCYKDKYALENKLNSNDERNIGIEFNDKDLKKQVSFKIRFPASVGIGKIMTRVSTWSTDKIFPIIVEHGPRNSDLNEGAEPEYNKEGFLGVQKEVSLSIINKHFIDTNAKNKEIPHIKMQRFPYPYWVSDPFVTMLHMVLPLLLILGYLTPANYIITELTIEKESQVKEALKIMGLSNFLHWSAWFLISLIICGISVVFIAILLKIDNPAVLNFTSFSLLLVFLLLYVIALITFCFAVSVFFNDAIIAATVGTFILILTYVPYANLIENYDGINISSKISLCLLINSALPLGIYIIAAFEGQETGSNWGNLFVPVSLDDSFTLGHVFAMLVIDAIIYLLIALYVEAIYPGNYGIPKSYLFPFHYSFWCSRKIENEEEKEILKMKSVFFEKEPLNLNATIKIRSLYKTYSNKKKAVQNLSFNMYEDQIMILLGHNGAGKTTTILMLCGMLEPTSGTIRINDYNVQTHIDEIRKSFGFCPQYNIIFNELTVENHLYFFGMLKGIKKKNINEEIEKYLKALDLTSKKSSRAKQLSGGMKRKLCIAIALCGNSKVVLLDEPTAGIDPMSRRAIWNLLISEKKNRTILLSTHFMDEADILGDRIAIMAGGNLQCCGTGFFLKKNFGVGYHLIIEKLPGCQVKKITELLSGYVPEVQVERNVGSELAYSLDEKYASSFEGMLQKLENNKEMLYIGSYGISLTTLEEVFLKVGAENGTEEFQVSKRKKSLSMVDTKIFSHEEVQLISGNTLRLNQIRAMFYKKILTTLRAWNILFFMFLIPLIMLVISFLSITSRRVGKDLPDLDITLDTYETPTTVVAVHNQTNPFYKNYMDIVGSEGKVVNVPVNEFESKVLAETKTHMTKFLKSYVIGAVFSSEKHIVAYFNNEPYHSPPLALETVLRAIVKTKLGPEYDISISNYPQPFTLKERLNKLKSGQSVGNELGTNINYIMVFVMAVFVIFYIQERISGCKHLQYVSGANFFIFWGVSFFWDILIYLLIAIFTVVLIVCFRFEGFIEEGVIETLVLILILFGLAVLPFTYVSSLFLSKPATGFIVLSTLYFIFGVVLYLMMISIITAEGNKPKLSKKLRYIFLWFPHYCLQDAINQLHLYQKTLQYCKEMISYCFDMVGSVGTICEDTACLFEENCCEQEIDYLNLENPGVGLNLIMFAIHSLFYFFLLYLMEVRIFNCLNKKKHKYIVDNLDEDEDIKSERKIVHEMSKEDRRKHYLVLLDVTKYYDKFLAVNQVCLALKKQECFGLLGLNGAGKTTLFKILTGDVRKNSGRVWVRGRELEKNAKKIYKNIGYCPQFDGLLEYLTGRETLIFFCMIRGVSYKDSKEAAKIFAIDFNFEKCIDKRVVEYSGGNKRKLSTAVSFIGEPKIILLDEPTAGMDPGARRHIWNNINRLRDKGKCIILTSHNMDECEALCTKATIMVNGEFKCLGSIQHLKTKFSQGYKLVIKVRNPEVTYEIENPNLKLMMEFVRKKFPTAVLKDNYQSTLSFNIIDSKLSWSQMFGIMEKAKNNIPIEDYFLGQCSLEEVFLHFTQTQKEVD